MRAVSGFPPFNRQDTRSVCWLRETSGRTVDAVGIAYLADCFPPRIYFIGAEPRPSSTITMSIYFHATAADFAALGDDFILSDAVGVRASKSTVASRLDLWSRQGALLATSEQLCWFR